MFDLSMFPTVTRVTRRSPVTRVTGVTQKTTTEFHLNIFKNNDVTGVTGKKASRLQEKLNKNNIVTDVTGVTGKKHNVRNNIDAEHEAFEERAAIMEYNGGLTRNAAETQARVICLAEFRHRKRYQ